MDHHIVYESNIQAVCACGTVLSIYGRTTTFAAELGRHIRTAREATEADADVAR